MARDLEIPVYDNDLGNRDDFQTASPKVEAALTVTAPSHKQKEFWCRQAELAGYRPKLYCIWLSKMQTFVRMKARSGLAKDESNTSDKWVHDWYKKYTRHPQEERLSARS